MTCGYVKDLSHKKMKRDTNLSGVEHALLLKREAKKTGCNCIPFFYIRTEALEDVHSTGSISGVVVLVQRSCAAL